MKTGAKSSGVSCLAKAQTARKTQTGLFESKYIFQQLPLSILRVDKYYQRALRQNLVKKIVDSYNPDLIGAILVSMRTDGYGYVIDGQHRLQAMRIMGIEEIPCLCYYGLTVEEEAKNFGGYNGARGMRISIHPWEMWRSMIAGKEKMALDIMKAATEAGFMISSTAAQDTTATIGTLFNLYSKIGPDGIARMFALLRFTWNGDKDSLSYHMIHGLGTLLYRAGNYVQNEYFISKLRRVAPIIIFQRSQLHTGNKGIAVAKILAEEYNKQSKNRFIPHNLLESSRQHEKS